MTSATFTISRDEEHHAVVVALSGDVDIAAVPKIRKSLEDVFEESCINLVLDLSQVTYVDSSALGLLVWLDHRMRPFDGRLMLAGPTPDVTRILELSGLVAVAATVAVSTSVQAALEVLDMPPASGEPLWTEHFDMPVDVNMLGAVRESVCSKLEPLGFPDPALFDIKVALGEALANALRHGVAAAEDGQVDVDVSVYCDRVVIEVSDNGVGFDGVHRGNSDVYASSGRGIMFMRALMDRVEFEPSPIGGTLVRISKHRPGCV